MLQIKIYLFKSEPGLMENEMAMLLEKYNTAENV
jgi:hypothetical protein